MITRVLAATEGCRDGNCPTVHQTDRQTVIVQGSVTFLESDGIQFPAGETGVEIPLEMLLRAARAAESS